MGLCRTKAHQDFPAWIRWRWPGMPLGATDVRPPTSCVEATPEAEDEVDVLVELVLVEPEEVERAEDDADVLLDALACPPVPPLPPAPPPPDPSWITAAGSAQD